MPSLRSPLGKTRDERTFVTGGKGGSSSISSARMLVSTSINAPPVAVSVRQPLARTSYPLMWRFSASGGSRCVSVIIRKFISRPYRNCAEASALAPCLRPRTLIGAIQTVRGQVGLHHLVPVRFPEWFLRPLFLAFADECSLLGEHRFRGRSAGLFGGALPSSRYKEISMRSTQRARSSHRCPVRGLHSGLFLTPPRQRQISSS